jgi:hypothetical protein
VGHSVSMQIERGAPRIQQAVQKGRSARPQRVKGRGGTYQASLEPLASITCERIVTLPPVGLGRYVEGLNDARTTLAGFFNSLC